MAAITERSATALAAAIRTREVTSLEVVEAHIDVLKRTAEQLNAVVVDRYEQARAEAAAVDAGLAGGTQPEGQLLGVPFTVKESIQLEGMPNAAGLLARRNHLAPFTAPSVQRVIDAGAIPLGVTNTSELTLSIESDNPLYGRTNNPYDLRRTAGGSSGGEGAAVGVGGSPFGVASDVAGSIRIPALFCGVFGHKPSSGLVPNTGMFPPSAGESSRMLSTGPITRRAEDLMPLLRLMAGPDGEDPVAREIELGDPAAVSFEGLSVTVVEESSMLSMSRELRDAREQAVGALLAAGAVVRRVKLRAWRRATMPYLAVLQQLGGSEARSTGELLVESGEEPPSLRSVFSRSGRHRLTTRIALSTELLPGSDRLPERQVNQGKRIAAQLIEAIGDGVLLHPAHPHPAPRHGRTIGRPWLMTPASVFNLAGVPVTEVPLGLSDAGLPLGVQVAAAHGADHLSIAVALKLEQIFGGWRPPALKR
jgi:fatty acid amide hydrolase 2